MSRDALAPPPPGADSPVPADIVRKPVRVTKRSRPSDALIPKTAADEQREVDAARRAHEDALRARFGFVPTGFVDQYGRPVNPEAAVTNVATVTAVAPPVAPPVVAPMHAAPPAGVPVQRAPGTTAIAHPGGASNAPLPGVQQAVAPQLTAQYPVLHSPTTQYPAAQYPFAQYPTGQYPTEQYPTAQYPMAPQFQAPYAAPYVPLVYALQPPKRPLSRPQKRAVSWGALAGQALWGVVLAVLGIAMWVFGIGGLSLLASPAATPTVDATDRDATTLMALIAFWMTPERIGWAFLIASIIVLALGTAAFFAQYAPMRSTKVRRPVLTTVLSTITVAAIRFVVDPILFWVLVVVMVMSSDLWILAGERALALFAGIWILASALLSGAVGIGFGHVYARAFRPRDDGTTPEPTASPAPAEAATHA